MGVRVLPFLNVLRFKSGKLVTVGEVGNATSLEPEVMVAARIGVVSLLSGRKDVFDFEGE